ncbi:ABC transporter substrate-binding protein [Dongia sedimenti]|uniref:ABC transporter substrate-binding protein n=1 Tax=Dongia sedimenti TaxID=3064282 RepID=A0ABU0YFE1_9PROT|nr:ABC transporter substrate-binding protein [Rhodospirillaceae bacterium R-7]
MKPFVRSALLAVGMSVSAFAFGAGMAQAATPKDTLVMAFAIDEIISLDPADIYEFSSSEYMANTYDRLVVINVQKPSELKFAAAESYTVSDDGKTFQFKIRPGIKFHSGNELTAEDAAFSLIRFVKINGNPAFIMNQFGLTKDNADKMIRAKDPMTLEIELDAAYAPSFFLNCLSYTSVVVDKKLVMEHEKDGDMGNGWMKTNEAGSGPFKLKSFKANEALILDSDDGYWDGAPKLKHVLIKNVTESATQQLLLQKGDIDVARNLLGDQLKAIHGDKAIKFVSSPKATLWYMGLNVKNKELGNSDVRQAMKYLVDYDGLAKTQFDGTGIKHQTFLPDGQLGADNDTPFKFDLKKAKDLLAKAGYPKGFDVTMNVANKSEFRALAASVQNSMSKAGVNLIIQLADNKTTLTKYRASEHDIYLGQWGSDYQDPHSNADGYLNAPLAKRNQWTSPERAAAVIAARDEKDATKRAQMYMDLQKQALEDSPYIIMFQQVETAAVRSNVDGFIIGPTFDLNLYRYTVKN